MPTRNGSSGSQSLRSDIGGKEPASLRAPIDINQFKKELSPHIKDKDYGEPFNTPTDSTVSKIAGVVNEIKEKIFAKKRNLTDLSDYDYKRYTGVTNDAEVGSRKVNKALEQLNLQTKMDGINPSSNARDYIVAMGNEVMKNAFLGGQNDFSNYITYRFGIANTKYGQEIAGELMRLGLEEGFDRMKRAGLVYMEKDLRLQ